MKKIKLAVLGCGDRGNVYASYALSHPDEAEVVAVCDVDPVALKSTGDKYRLPENMRFSSIDAFLRAGVKCDAVINATMDPAHYETTKRLIKAGYNQLLEKPVVNNAADLYELRDLAREKGVSILVCHVLRYTPFYRSIKQAILDGKIGKILTMEMNEHVGTVHFADSFIRGKWSDEDVCGSGLLLQKCCHDTDLMCWLNNATVPAAVSSFGERAFFTEDNAPEGATEFCYNCPCAGECLYNAQKIHLGLDNLPFQTWRGIGKHYTEITREEKEVYLRVSDYGRCVFKLKRNLADRQMVTVRFRNGSMATLTVVGGDVLPGRDINIVGSKGKIQGRMEDNVFHIYTISRENDGYKNVTETVDVTAQLGDGRHGNGDVCLMHDYVRYLNGDRSSISITALDDSVNGHLCVYAAEKSRKEGTFVPID